VHFQNNDGASTIVKLILNQPLDREIQDFYSLRIIAEDEGKLMNLRDGFH
jgi:hypothetical protein